MVLLLWIGQSVVHSPHVQGFSSRVISRGLLRGSLGVQCIRASQQAEGVLLDQQHGAVRQRRQQVTYRSAGDVMCKQYVEASTMYQGLRSPHLTRLHDLKH
jgi:hypothetical protein